MWRWPRAPPPNNNGIPRPDSPLRRRLRFMSGPGPLAWLRRRAAADVERPTAGRSSKPRTTPSRATSIPKSAPPRRWPTSACPGIPGRHSAGCRAEGLGDLRWPRRTRSVRSWWARARALAAGPRRSRPSAGSRPWCSAGAQPSSHRRLPNGTPGSLQLLITTGRASRIAPLNRSNALYLPSIDQAHFVTT